VPPPPVVPPWPVVPAPPVVPAWPAVEPAVPGLPGPASDPAHDARLIDKTPTATNDSTDGLELRLVMMRSSAGKTGRAPVCAQSTGPTVTRQSAF
jgi:hypothetical protein